MEAPVRHDLTHLEKRPKRPLVVMKHGGSNRATSKKPEACHANANVAADAGEPLTPDMLAPSVIPVPLGNNMSLASVNGIHGDFTKIIEHGGNHLFSKGAEASRAIGHASAKATFSSPHAQDDAEKQYYKTAATVGGTFSTCDVLSTYGSGGQNGSGVVTEDCLLVPFRREVSELVVERFGTGYTLNSRLGRGRKLTMNFIAWFVCTVYWLRTISKKNLNEVRLLTVTDFQAAQTEEEKEYHVGSFFQAYLTEQVRAHRAEHRNIIADNSAGRISIVRHGFFNPIPASIIAAEARRSYLAALKNLQRTGAQPLAVEDALKLSAAKVPNGNALTLQSLVTTAEKIARSKEKRSEKMSALKKLLEEAALSPQDFQVDAVVKYKDQEPIKLAGVLEYLDKLGNGFQAFKLRRRIVETLLRDVTAKLAELKVAQQRQKRSLARRVAWLGWTLIWFAAVTGLLVARFLILGIPRKVRLNFVARAFMNVVRAALAFAELTSAISFLERVAQTLATEKLRLDRQLDNAVASLENTQHFDPATVPQVVLLDLEQAWAVLRQMHPQQADLNEDTLSRLVAFVTGRGLQLVLGAADADAESLAKAAFTREPNWGPNFANKSNWAVDDEFVVLPPVEPTLKGLLAGQAKALGKLLFFADSATYCVATKLRIATPIPFEVGALSELISGPLLAAFKETLKGDKFHDFYPDTDALRAAHWAASQLKIRPSAAFQVALAKTKTKKPRNPQTTTRHQKKSSELIEGPSRLNGHASDLKQK